MLDFVPGNVDRFEVKRTVDPSRSLPVGKCVLAVVLAAAVAGFFYYDLDRYLSFEALKTHRDALLALAEANYGTAVAVFMISYALITGVSLPGAVIMTLAGGFLFGSVLGTTFCGSGWRLSSAKGWMRFSAVLPRMRSTIL
ncbi:hypothetical protein BH20PSE1_BH20PSE1_19170 [soil metagenome]